MSVEIYHGNHGAYERRSRPLDMVAYGKGGRDYALMSNNSRGVMKISESSRCLEQLADLLQPIGAHAWSEM